jgi:hypothetical protein
MLCGYVAPGVVRIKVYVCRGLLLWVAGSNPERAWIFVFFICCVLCSIGLLDELLARSVECVSV